MSVAKSITFRNYRSYGSAGAVIPLQSEFTALVGVNNTGKSTLLRSFWELQSLYGLLGGLDSGRSEFGNLFGAGLGYSPRVNDGERVPPVNDNSSPRIRIDLAHHSDDSSAISAVEVILSRAGTVTLELTMEDGTVLSNLREFANVSAGGDKVLMQAKMGDSTYSIDWLSAREAILALADSFYVGAFRNAVNSGQATYYDMQIGKGFIETFDSYRNGSNADQNEAANTMARELAEIFGFRDLQINVSTNKDHLLFMVDGKSYRGSELGAGITQFVVVAANVLVRRPYFLLIDEPELNLHASLQARFLALLAKYARGPVIFSTHSLGLARSTADEILVSTRDDSNRSVLRPYAAEPSLSLVLGELGYGGLHDTAYKAVLLVEGVTEVRSIQRLLVKYGIHNEVVVISLGGDDIAVGDRGQELAELRRLADKVFAMVDSEQTSESGTPGSRRVAFAADCKAQGIDCHILKRRSFENYLSQDVARTVLAKPNGVAFGPYDKPDASWEWSKPRNWRIVDAMAKSDLEGTDLGAFIERVADSVRGS